ncbi:unnamed protein product [Rotaria sordida]|uniref:Uncharacterized protein n=1 Tax=Rotaria sordida TaxID=392033 RepID=A0A819HL02_9BILA|nr:unnamed protein product [Rotaria sordida]CAF0865516.1 unnamed protein product [Rotaria sordida]CAF0875678.1 unnamed protein product [Rotaria sordida]CAF0901439.1 unnamed protein product [Rotaria sordida]CAF0905674.1 unnamed protein product [Rotaria sordida]
MIIANYAYARVRHLNNYERRMFGCGGLRASCKGLFSKSCCSGYVCHKNTGKCVQASTSGSGSWLDDRNGK